MKILLVVPTFNYKERSASLLSLSDFPTGFAYVASALKAAGHEVYGLNPNNVSGYEDIFYMLSNKLSQAIEEVKPDLIGLGGICTDFSFLHDAIEIIRTVAPLTPIVLGGGIITNDREFIFQLLKPDFGIVGEGEETVVALSDGLSEKTGYGHIANLSYWEDKLPVHNPVSHDYKNLDDRPLPDYEPFGADSMMDYYSMATRLLYRYSRTHPRVMPIVTARGCPFNCTFCVHRGNQHYRDRSIESIMEEIKVHYERYHFNILLILDELFAVNKERMRAFCEAVLLGKEKYGWDFDWLFQTHASAALDKDTLMLAKKAGCVFFSYGLESASPTVIKSMNKKTKVSQIIEAIKLADETGIGFGGNLIFGDPAETQETIYESLNFFAKYCGNAFVFLGMLMPYPGNKLFDHCAEKGIIQDKAAYYGNIDNGVFNMTTMPNSIWYQWVNFFILLERSWLWIKDTDAVSVEKEEYSDPVLEHRKVRMYQIAANCPHCGERIVYREMIGQAKGDLPLFLGVGCKQCNKRIKINLKIPVADVKSGAKEEVCVG